MPQDRKTNSHATDSTVTAAPSAVPSTGDAELDALLAGAVPTKALNVSIDARVYDAWVAWIKRTGAPKGKTVSLVLQRFLESNGATIPGVTKPPTS